MTNSQPPAPAPCLPQMQEKAREIYMTFLSSKASSQVNVEGQSRLNEKMLEEPHPLMFQKLQDQVTRLPYPHLGLKPTFVPGLEEFSQTLNIRHPGSCPIQLGRLRHTEAPWLAKGGGLDSTPRRLPRAS